MISVLIWENGDFGYFWVILFRVFLMDERCYTDVQNFGFLRVEVGNGEFFGVGDFWENGMFLRGWERGWD